MWCVRADLYRLDCELEYSVRPGRHLVAVGRLGGAVDGAALHLLHDLRLRTHRQLDRTLDMSSRLGVLAHLKNRRLS